MTTHSYREERQSNGFATAGMVLGIVALALSWIPILGFVSIPLALIGLPLSVLGFVKKQSLGQSIAGMATNTVALIICVIYIAAIASA